MNKGKRSKIAQILPGKKLSILQWAGVSQASTIVLFTMLLMVLGTGLSVVRTTHENRFSFNQLQELRSQANQLEVEWGQLLIEQSTFGIEGRIEQKAVAQLHMQVPEIDSIVMVANE